jgi:GNAT superfamily N-acetyltransferase
MARIAAATGEAELELAREIWREYARVIDDPAWFPAFERDLAEIGERYGPPGGVFLLAWEGDELVGCGALRRLDDEAAEIRRVYVRPRFRAKGLARTISMALMGEARRIGYSLVRLDIPPRMAEAIKLFASLGFSPIPPYAGQPAGALCMEARVRSGAARK